MFPASGPWVLTQCGPGAGLLTSHSWGLPPVPAPHPPSTSCQLLYCSSSAIQSARGLSCSPCPVCLTRARKQVPDQAESALTQCPMAVCPPLKEGCTNIAPWWFCPPQNQGHCPDCTVQRIPLSGTHGRPCARLSGLSTEAERKGKSGTEPQGGDPCGDFKGSCQGSSVQVNSCSRPSTPSSPGATNRRCLGIDSFMPTVSAGTKSKGHPEFTESPQKHASPPRGPAITGGACFLPHSKLNPSSEISNCSESEAPHLYYSKKTESFGLPGPTLTASPARTFYFSDKLETQMGLTRLKGLRQGLTLVYGPI